jgi:RNA polymerase sigma-70 factor (ECF subfamily)
MADHPDCESRFNGIYDQFARKVFAYFSSGFGPDVAEDLSQQTFLNVWRHLEGNPWMAPDSWAAWIFRVARNVRNDHLRAKGYRQPPLPYEDALVGTTEDRSDVLEQQIAIRTAFVRLLPEDQELLLYKTIGMNSDETGNILGLSASAVRSRMQRARERFRALLEENGVETDA